MSLRIRRTANGIRIALCAARSIEKPGDIYLDDADHRALMDKFCRDYEEMGIPPRSDPIIAAIVEIEESNNPNRTEWDKTWGGSPGHAPGNRADAPPEGTSDRQAGREAEGGIPSTASRAGIPEPPHPTNSPIQDAFMRDLPKCPKCGAWRGDPCRTPMGSTTKAHRDRGVPDRARPMRQDAP